MENVIDTADTAAKPRPAITVLIVDDHPLLIQGLISLLSGQPGISVVGHASDGREAVALARELEPAVVVMDLVMPEMDGVEATGLILASCPSTRIIGLSTMGRGRTVRHALDAGMHAYIPKLAAVDELVEAIRAVAAGESYVSTRLGPMEPKPETLTSREQQVLGMLAAGKSEKEIAIELDVSVKTVETHRITMKHKLGIFNMAELTKYALREGMATL